MYIARHWQENTDVCVYGLKYETSEERRGQNYAYGEPSQEADTTLEQPAYRAAIVRRTVGTTALTQPRNLAQTKCVIDICYCKSLNIGKS
jgi:hypothetical protein